ncbi:MAG: glycoside hydrolase family 127 protein [Pontiellaceae bacterium]|nr:glycoside hydrolase family 127 protein [Pontiellaceae bacterium]
MKVKRWIGLFAVAAGVTGCVDTPSTVSADKLGKDVEVAPEQPAKMFAVEDVRLLESPFLNAVEINREYLLAHKPDRLLAPFLREAGLEPKAEPYGNWESDGLDGHTAGHYLSAMALMMAAGADEDGEFKRRLDYMIDELDAVQQANGNGYLGGIPGSAEYWARVADGHVEIMGQKWAPWYNLHKMFAGLRDAYLLGGNEKARDLLVRYGDWCDWLASDLSDEQMQRMIGTEYGGMNEVLADIYAITGDEKYLTLAKRFNHKAIFEPLENHEDQLTGLHANTQIPKIIGMERIAALAQDDTLHSGAEFFWQTVTRNRSLAFGGNSVSEHFNPVDDFSGVVEHREGPESCNTYNMLRLTEQLFAAEPKAEYADFYERALYNHILASINPETPGYVYFTSIRPDHYRVYSVPEHAFWCCVGTGMENPGRYGGFIYAQAEDGVYVNLFIPSEVSVEDRGLVLKQENTFPEEARTKLTLELEKASTFTLYIRHPAWVAEGEFAVKVNGKTVKVDSTPSSYAAIERKWKDGDRVEVELPMHLRTERLPDDSDWLALMYGPVVLANPDGTENMDGLFADEGRMAHVAHGPMIPLDKVPALLTTEEELLDHVVADQSAGPLRFRIKDVIDPVVDEGLPLIPFYQLHERRYQMYWELTTADAVEARRERLAEQERAREAREAATIDWIAVGEQQPEVEHDLEGEGMESGVHNGRHWRHGRVIQYTLDPKGSKDVILAATYSGDDNGREFDILVDGIVIATQRLTREKPNYFIEKRYTIPREILEKAGDNRITVRFVATRQLAGGLFDVRLLKPGAPEMQPFN